MLSDWEIKNLNLKFHPSFSISFLRRNKNSIRIFVLIIVWIIVCYAKHFLFYSKSSLIRIIMMMMMILWIISNYQLWLLSNFSSQSSITIHIIIVIIICEEGCSERLKFWMNRDKEFKSLVQKTSYSAFLVKNTINLIGLFHFILPNLSIWIESNNWKNLEQTEFYRNLTFRI